MRSSYLSQLNRLHELADQDIRGAAENEALRVVQICLETYAKSIATSLLTTTKQNKPDDHSPMAQLHFLAEMTSHCDEQDAMRELIIHETRLSVERLTLEHGPSIARLLLDEEYGDIQEDPDVQGIFRHLKTRNVEKFEEKLKHICMRNRKRWSPGYRDVLEELITRFGTDQPDVSAVELGGNMGRYYVERLQYLLRDLNIGLKIERVGGERCIYELQKE